MDGATTILVTKFASQALYTHPHVRVITEVYFGLTVHLCMFDCKSKWGTVWYLIAFVEFCALPSSHVTFIVQWTRMPTQSQLKKERRKRRRKTMVAMKMAPNPFPRSVPVSSYPQPTRKCVFICIIACVQSTCIYLNQCEFSGFEDVVITSWRYVISRCVFCQSSLWAALL